MADEVLDSALQGALAQNPNLAPHVEQQIKASTPVEPSEGERLFKAHFEQGLTGTMMKGEYWKERLWPSDETPVSTEQLMDLMDKDQMWGDEDSFASVRTMGQYVAKRNDIVRERGNQEVIKDASMMANLGMGLVAGAADPINWIPIGRAGQLYHAGSGALRVGAETGVLMGAFQAAQEGPLHLMQQTRTLADSIEAVGAATLLGGFIGAAPGTAYAVGSGSIGKIALKLRDEAVAWAKGIDFNAEYLARANQTLANINDEILKNPMGRVVNGVQQPSVLQLKKQGDAFNELTAATERAAQLKDNTIATAGPMEFMRTFFPRMMGQFHAGFLDPQTFVMKQGASLEARLGYQQINEVNLLLNKNIVAKSSTGDAQATGRAVTTEMDRYRGGWAQFYGDMWGQNFTDSAKGLVGAAARREFGKSAYVEARAAGFAGNKEDFSREVANAVVDGYVHSNPGVQRAARSYQSNIAEPLRDLMVRAGYQDPGASPRHALGYLPRQYIVANVRGQDGMGTNFKNLVEKGLFDERIAELQAKGVTINNGHIGQARRHAKNTSQEIYDTITRDGHDGMDSFIPLNQIKAGNAFEKRVVPVSDKELLANGFISYDITNVADTHMRRTMPSLLLAERFKTPTGLPDPSLESSLIPKIVKEYNEKLGSAVGGEARDKLNQERDTMLQVMRNRRDGLLQANGFALPGEISQKAQKLTNLTLTYQAMRSLGNLLISSLPDVAGLQFQHGLKNEMLAFFNDITRTGMFKHAGISAMPADEAARTARTWGAVMEWHNNAGMASHMDMNVPYGDTGRTERAFHNMARAFSVANFSIPWNDAIKLRAWRAGENHILEGAERGWSNLRDSEKQWFANMGIDEKGLGRIEQAWRGQQIQHDGFLRFGDINNWTDQEAANIFGSAQNKARASTLIQPRSGDKAYLWETNPILRLVGQFQNFTSSHTLRVLSLAEQRLVADGFVGRDSLRVYGGMLQYAMLGGLSAYLGAVAADYGLGVKPGEKSRADKLIESPGMWFAQALDKSGLLGIAGNLNNQMEKTNGGIGLNKAISVAAGDKDNTNHTLDRWKDLAAGERIYKAYAGPTGGQALDVARWGADAMNSKMTSRDARTMSQLFPMQNNWFMRRHVFEPATKYLTEDVLGQRYR